MKLVLCRKCQDVFRLTSVPRKCSCGESKGWYVDSINAVYDGDNAVPIGFGNDSLVSAVRVWNQLDPDRSAKFEAFVIAPHCSTFSRKRSKHFDAVAKQKRENEAKERRAAFVVIQGGKK